VAKFRVRRAFEQTDPLAYVLAVNIIEGQIGPGMWVDFVTGVSWRQGSISAIEFHKGSREGNVWLIFRCTEEELGRWNLMAIRDDIMEAFEPPKLIAGLD
jgi:hypothetical protein